MFGTIVLAVDGSDHAHKAVELARELALAGGDEVVVTHVTELLPTGS
jgi:nucleotide-binding universal stress UspA family protein